MEIPRSAAWNRRRSYKSAAAPPSPHFTADCDTASVAMDVHRAGMMNFQDCDMDEMDMKNRKIQHLEERFDSGVDSLKEDEYMKIVEEMEILRFEDPIANPKGTCESWTQEVTEDGDT